MKWRPDKQPLKPKATRFAWLPRKMSSGTWVWFERYTRVNYSEYKY